MKIAAIAFAAAMSAGAAQAATLIQPSKTYEFSGSGAEAAGGPAMSLGRGATFSGEGATQGMNFAKNQGPVLAGGIANPAHYSVEMFFSLSEGSTSFLRVLDFKNGKSDAGIYFERGDLLFYGAAPGSVRYDSNVTTGSMTHLVLTRDANDTFSAYLNGVLAISFFDPDQKATAVFTDGIARFFRDDGGEAAPGFVDFIRIYDEAISQQQVSTLYAGGTPLRDFASAVPEPGAWALMIAGFGLTGAGLRRRRAAVALEDRAMAAARL